MTIALKVSVDTRRVDSLFNDLKVKIPESVGEGIYDAGEAIVRELKSEILRQNLYTPIKGLYRSIKVRRTSKNRFQISMFAYGIDLDQRTPRWIALKRGRNITLWAEFKAKIPQKPGASQSKYPLVIKALKVRKHPWIEEPTNRALRELHGRIKRKLSKGMRR